MKQTSGFDALIDALKQSGMDVDSSDFKGASTGSSTTQKSNSSSTRVNSSSTRAESASAKTGSTSTKQNQGSRPETIDDFLSGFGGGATGGGQPPFDVEIPFLQQISAWGKKALIGAAILLILIGLAAYWWFHPPINIHSTDTWMFVGLFVLLPLFLLFWSKSYNYTNGNDNIIPDEKKAKTFKLAAYIPVGVALIGVVGAIMSLVYFPGNAEKYASILETTTNDFAEDIQEVDYSEIPVIDHDSAVLLGDREMGSISEYVSQFEISSLYSQINYEGEPYRVSPLEYADLFKWFTNREDGIPAYALVNMTTQDAEIVKLEDSAIYYTESEPLGRNIDRYVQLSYPFYIFDEKSFELDDDGNPWWVCPVRTYTIGLFGGATIERVVLVNASTGETYDYAVEEVPDWVDQAYPADLLITQYNWFGAYSSGWLNSIFGQSGVVQTTPGTDGLLGYNYIAKDGDVWVYTGVTSATSDSSIVGFVLVNQRTAESHFYSVSGATEASAMQSAEGEVQDLGYDATFPLLINIEGQPTYFMALKDAAGLVKTFAMIDIQRYQNVAIGATVATCQESYVALLATNGVISTETITLDTVEAEGVIANIAQAVIDGDSHFYITLEGDDAIYDFALPGLIKIIGYEVGDTVSFVYVESDPTNTVEDLLIDGESSVTDSDTSDTEEAEETEEVAEEVEESDESADSEGDAV